MQVDETAARFFVSGRVQGVFFRDTTRKQATKLGLRGYAINLPDGRVEVVACGRPASVEGLERWLWVGSPAASVESVDREDIAVDAVTDEAFRTG